jgi:hypothetical protein
MGALVRLEWTRYPDGFELTNDPRRFAHIGASADGRYLVPRKLNKSETYLLEGTKSRVYRALAKVQDDDASVLDFVNEWGCLTRRDGQYADGHTSPTEFAKIMRAAIAAAERKDPTVGDGGATNKTWMHRLAVVPRLLLRRGKLAGDSAPRLFFEPRDLWGFCRAEFLQRIDGTTWGQCQDPECGAYFAPSDFGQPRRYCSNACKQAHYRRQSRASSPKRLRASA